MHLLSYFPLVQTCSSSSDVPSKAGPSGFRRHGQHAGRDHRDPGLLWLPGRPHPQQQHEGQSSCSERLSGDGQAADGQQLLRTGHAGQRWTMETCRVRFRVCEGVMVSHLFLLLFQVCCPPWSPGEPVTCCSSTASRGNLLCLFEPHVSLRSKIF